ncbi:MAG: DNA double-strand break repair nuclease NurA [Caldiserica bacterium]|nr:DNA double-strand break repair nuclease NurA [Caldisericota bacterium]
MLKIDKIIPQVEKIVEEKYSENLRKISAIDFVIKKLKEIKPEDLKNVTYKETLSLFGTPIEIPGRAIKVEKEISDYTAIAADGSEVPINEDFFFPYYIINIGFIALKYGKDHFFFADSNAKIYFEENELYEKVGDKSFLVRGEFLSSKMLLEESKKLEELLKDFYTVEVPVLALFDGTLIQWEIKETSETYKNNFVKNFQRMILIAEQLKAPLAGYISGTHSRDVMEMIRIFLEMKGEDFNKQLLSIIKDADIFKIILRKGERSAIFRSNAPILNLYKAPIYFFFLNVGSEVVRIEIPEFIAFDNDLLEKTCALILSQSNKGEGYPVVLKEAHEQAVIKSSERVFIEELFIDFLRKKGIIFNQNYKFLSKKIRNI